jgi:signal transduction histidine kinase
MALLVVFLVVTLALTLWLGSQALSAARSHRRTAEGILRDYAGIAAWEFSRRVREHMDEFAWEIFDDVPRRVRHRIPPGPQVVEWEMDDALRRVGCRRCRGLEREALFFRWSVPDSVLVTHEPARASFSAATIPAFEEALASRLVFAGDTARAHRMGYFTAPPEALLEDASLTGYAVTTDEEGRGRFVYGFIAPLGRVEELFATWYGREGLLPEVVARGEPNDSLLSLSVRSVDGERVFSSAETYPQTFEGRTALPGEYGSLVVEVVIRPDAARHLVIGGLPRSRLPLLLALMVLALGVGVAALFQIRREQHLARLREDFISGVSHEFRTPLTQIRMFTDLLADGKLRTPEEQNRSTEVIRREARRLTHLVENILQFSRSRREGGTSGGLEEVAAGGALRELADSFAPLAGARNASLEVEADPGLRVEVERGHLHQMLGNLLDNALKYGPEGQSVRLRAVSKGDLVRFSVEDEGPGIPHRHREEIWDPYRRLDRDLEGPVRGSGIGLSVVAEMASRYGGSVRVEDAPGGGARFVVELPASEGRRGTPGPVVDEGAASGPVGSPRS